MKIKKISPILKFFLGKDIIGITLAPFGIYLHEKYVDDITTINHEKIHWKQQIEMLILFFYIWYVIEWLWRTIFYGNMGYYMISFEQEAYNNDQDINYLITRKNYSWFKYLKHGK